MYRRKKRKELYCRVCVFILAGFCLMMTSGCNRDSDEEILLEEPEIETEIAEIKEEVKEEDPESPVQEVIYVYVCGQVASPGVYELPAGSRVYEAIGKAGGVLDTAAAECMNQAAVVEDGQRLYVPAEGEVGMGDIEMEENGSSSDGRVNINTAGKEELMTLSGIGERKAEAILAYREANGGFREVEELMQVEGIKEGTYNKIKDSIKVS